MPYLISHRNPVKILYWFFHCIGEKTEAQRVRRNTLVPPPSFSRLVFLCGHPRKGLSWNQLAGELGK